MSIEIFDKVSVSDVANREEKKEEGIMISEAIETPPASTASIEIEGNSVDRDFAVQDSDENTASPLEKGEEVPTLAEVIEPKANSETEDEYFLKRLEEIESMMKPKEVAVSVEASPEEKANESTTLFTLADINQEENISTTGPVAVVQNEIAQEEGEEDTSTWAAFKVDQAQVAEVVATSNVEDSSETEAIPEGEEEDTSTWAAFKVSNTSFNEEQSEVDNAAIQKSNNLDDLMTDLFGKEEKKS